MLGTLGSWLSKVLDSWFDIEKLGKLIKSRQTGRGLRYCLAACKQASMFMIDPYSNPWNFLQVDCQNYIRVLAKTQDGRLLVCGTNAYNPKCRYYSHNATHSSVDREFSGKGFCPYDPRHNSTSLYAGKDIFSIRVTVDKYDLSTDS